MGSPWLLAGPPVPLETGQLITPLPWPSPSQPLRNSYAPKTCSGRANLPSSRAKGGGGVHPHGPRERSTHGPARVQCSEGGDQWAAEGSLTEKKKCSRTSFPKKARGHSMCSTMVGGGWRLAVGGGWRLAVGNWRLVAVGGGWRRLVVGDRWLVAVGSGWQLAVGRRWRLAAVGCWRLVAAGGWRLAVPWGGP